MSSAPTTLRNHRQYSTKLDIFTEFHKHHLRTLNNITGPKDQPPRLHEDYHEGSAKLS